VTSPDQLDDGTDDSPVAAADLANKPVLEWTTEDWRRWAHERDVKGASTSTEVDEVADEVAAAPAMEWWSQRPEPTAIESAPEVAAPAKMPAVVVAALDPADAQDLVAGTRSAPAHRRHAKSHATRRAEVRARPVDGGATQRARSALGLVATAVLVGAVVASLVTITAFVASLVLERALN